MKSVVVALALAGLDAGLGSASAQSTLLFDYNKVWRYNDTGANLGTTWKDRNFNDSSWPSQRSVFLAKNSGTETLYTTAVQQGASISSPSLQRTNTAGTGQVATYYFRTYFSYSGPTSGVLLLISNLVDDGAVFWLNGTELTRVHMPGGTVTATTYAGGTAVEASRMGDGTTGSNGGYTELAVSPTNLLVGSNTLAVEIHDGNATSSDVVFGMSLASRYIRGPVITRQPASVTTYSNQTVTLTVAATGDLPLSYQWQRDCGSGYVNINGAVGTSFTMIGVGNQHACDYRVIVSNIGGSVTSQVATITVLPDIIKPVLLHATCKPYPQPGIEPYKVDLVFSEPITLTAANAATYTIKVAGTSTTLTNGVRGFPSGGTVTLVTAPWNTNNNYVVSISNLRDRAGNLLEPTTEVGLGFTSTTEIFSMSHPWRFYTDGSIEDNVEIPNGIPAGSWKTNNMPASWDNPPGPYLYGIGPGVFYFEFEFGLTNLCGGSKGTGISAGTLSDYFSTAFTVPAVGANAQFELHGVIDDGVVFYLNGKEVYRWNMPGGEVVYGTLASSGIGNATCITNYFGVTNLVSGSNILSAELHQSSQTSSDKVFGCGLVASLTTYYTPQPELFAADLTEQALIYWSGPGYALEYTTSFPTNTETTVWYEIPDASNQYFITPGSQPHFYRLRVK